MYTDVLLFWVSGVCALSVLILSAYLAFSRKRGRMYRSILRQETESIGALSTAALKNTSAAAGIAISAAGSDDAELWTDLRYPSDGGVMDPLTGGGATDWTTPVGTPFARPVPEQAAGFDDSVLEGRYRLLGEIKGGGMSRIFLAEHIRLGNRWIVKFIPHENGTLANEENILKLLNHHSLPRIIDIFRDGKGVYLVESFIEGVSLDKLLKSEQPVHQFMVLEWAEQLTQALNYLHNLDPYPIYHLDLKPSNIMITHDSRLVLIDFGISKRMDQNDSPALGVTYKYAAPEQLKHRIPEKYRALIQSRFGELPAERARWNPDGRTDIYSLGLILFELVMGRLPAEHAMEGLKERISHEFYEIIRQCLAVDPDQRHPSAGALLAELQKVKGSRLKMARTLFMRRAASVAIAVAFVAGASTLTGGYYIYGQESAALCEVDPESVTVSLQQSTQLTVQRKMPDGQLVALDNSRIRWTFSQDDIARLDGNRLSGVNIGTTQITGLYRNKSISLDVQVVEPMDGMVNIVQHYRRGHEIQLFAGGAERERRDGPLDQEEFISPESLDIAEDGTVYLTDAGTLRAIRGDWAESIAFEPDYLSAHKVRCDRNQVYILTDPWEDGEDMYYGMIRLTRTETAGAVEAADSTDSVEVTEVAETLSVSAEGLYMSDARYTAVEDFDIDAGGRIYFIHRNAGMAVTELKTLDPDDPDAVVTLCELPEGTSALTLDETGAVYLANPESGAIQIWRDGALSYFAGIEGERAFIDGAAPLFYRPQRLRYADGLLYIWDFNVLRQIRVQDGVAAEAITLAGEAGPTFDMNFGAVRQAAEDVILPNSELTDFAVTGDGQVLLTDPKRGRVLTYD